MRKTVFFITLISLCSAIFSDSNSMDDIFNKRKEKFNKTMDKKIKEYDKERSERDLKFNKRLKESWELFDTTRESFGMEPKPEKLPVAKEVKLKKSIEPDVIIIPTTPKEIKPTIKEPKLEEFNFSDKIKKTTINFYGDKLKITYPKALQNIKITSVSDKSISSAWESSSKTEYVPLITQINNYIKKYRLNPWGAYKLVTAISNKIYRNDSSRIIFTGFTLTQLGMNCKIAHSDNRAYILLPSNKPLYGKPYLTIDEKKFYIITPVKGRISRIKTYTADFPGSANEFNLTINRLPLLKEVVTNKRLTFDYNGVKHTLDITYNKTLIDFFEDYPQTHYENYFNTDLSPSSRKRLIDALKPIIQGKSEAEAVNILLHFVQKSFEYQTDQEQFNREKPLFPEETLHYRFSDCEDRSVLFTYLVKEMLGLEVVGLKYPGHMSSAVLLKEVGEDMVTIGKKEFTIADPTFINANIGMAMPSYRGTIPEVIGIR